MAGEIIREGDKTSHGGIVLEGSQHDICHGRFIAYKGHQTYCPRCKGNFPIAEGVGDMTFYGEGVALAGMKTACGAILIASQFTDTVEWSRGGNGAQADALSAATTLVAREAPTICLECLQKAAANAAAFVVRS
jgi:uncharacterized Zn-binding protein involved in type VI secretion